MEGYQVNWGESAESLVGWMLLSGTIFIIFAGWWMGF